jgi:signal transduction histidine kinase
MLYKTASTHPAVDAAAAASRPWSVAEWHARMPLAWLVAEAVALVAGIGFVDYATGYEVTFFPFYSIPILLVLWFGTRRWAVIICILSALAWGVADMASGHAYSNEALRIWDMIVRLMFFCLIVLAGDGFRRWRDANRARIELLERSQQLEKEIIGISERERQSFGRDLHDDLGQYLVAIGFAADALKKKLEQESSAGAHDAGQIADQLNNAVVRTRNLAHGISPVDQGEGGLELALEQLAYSASRLSGISCTFMCDGEVRMRNNTNAVHLYRIAQEALNNAMKHGRSKVIAIALEAHEGHITLRVSDDGVGFDPAAVENKGMGMNTMQYRARMMNGALEIHPNPPTGTVVSCTIDSGEVPDSVLESHKP